MSIFTIRNNRLEIVAENLTIPELKVTLKNKDLITLHAVNASLKEAIEEIGKKLNIKVVAYLSEDEKITEDFIDQDFNKIIKSLSGYANIIYFTDSQKSKITKIIVTPKRK